MRATEAAQPGYTGAPIRYLHTKEIDAFYHSSQTISGGAIGKTKVRVTRDQNSGQIKNDPKASVRKSRIADMNIYSPKRGFDFRISVSVEEAGELSEVYLFLKRLRLITSIYASSYTYI